MVLLCFLCCLCIRNVRSWDSSSVEGLDLEAVNPKLKGFHGGFVADFYGYIVGDHKGKSGYITRFALDTFAVDSVVDLQITDPELTGFKGGFQHGSYGYAVPGESDRGSGPVPFGKVVRFSLNMVQVEVLNLETYSSLLKGFSSGFVDGSYAYLAPASNDVSFGGPHGNMVRFQLSTFSQVEVLDLTLADPELMGFGGAFSDGTYGYTVPDKNPANYGLVARFDLITFANIDVLDLQQGSSRLRILTGGFAVFGYAFFLPSTADVVGRFRLNAFGASPTIDKIHVNQVDPRLDGFSGGFHDGYYGYLIPRRNTVRYGMVTRFSLTEFDSVDVLDLEAVNPLYDGFRGGFTDGVYGYVTSLHTGHLVRFAVGYTTTSTSTNTTATTTTTSTNTTSSTMTTTTSTNTTATRNTTMTNVRRTSTRMNSTTHMNSSVYSQLRAKASNTTTVSNTTTSTFVSVTPNTTSRSTTSTVNSTTAKNLTGRTSLAIATANTSLRANTTTTKLLTSTTTNTTTTTSTANSTTTTNTTLTTTSTTTSTSTTHTTLTIFGTVSTISTISTTYHTSTLANTSTTMASCETLPLVTPPASLEIGCVGRAHGSKCHIICPNSPGEKYSNIGRPFYTCRQGQYERPGSDYLCAPDRCNYAPRPILGQAHTNCSDLAHGASCQMRCPEGTERPPGADSFQCQAGTWQIPGSCHPQGARLSLRTASVVHVELAIHSDLAIGSKSEESFGYEWAIKHQKSIAAAIGTSIGTSLSSLQIDIRPNLGSSRLLGARSLNRRSLRSVLCHIGLIYRVPDELLTSGKSHQEIADDVIRSLFGMSEANANQTGPSAGFISALINHLNANGESLPAGLLHAVPALVGEPRFLQNYAFVAPEWFSFEWEQCSSSCGTGERIRKVACAAGTICFEEMPQTSESCDDFDGCPFDPLCPLGRGGGFGCGAQVGVLLACCSSCLCVFILAYLRRWMRQTSTEGTKHIRGLQQKMSFQIVYPSVAERVEKRLSSLSNIVSPRGSCSMDMMSIASESNYVIKPSVGWRASDAEREAFRSHNDGKIHVIWDITNVQVISWQDEESFDDAEFILSEASAYLEGVYDSDINSFLNTDSSGTVIKPFIEDGTHIEYYSTTHNCWLLAKIQSEVRKHGAGSTIAYHASIGPRQRLFDVPLNLFRRCLKNGDFVEFFSMKGGGKWHAAVINGVQAYSATSAGYRIRMHNTGEVIPSVSPSRLRLRFLPGQKVYAYRGPSQGWVEGEVEESAPVDGLGADEIPIVPRTSSREELPVATRDISRSSRVGDVSPSVSKPFIEKSSQRKVNDLDLHRGISSYAGAKLLNKAIATDPIRNPSTSSLRKLGQAKNSNLWVDVPVILDGSSDVQWIPSYLLLHRSKPSNRLTRWII